MPRPPHATDAGAAAGSVAIGAYGLRLLLRGAAAAAPHLPAASEEHDAWQLEVSHAAQRASAGAPPAPPPDPHPAPRTLAKFQQFDFSLDHARLDFGGNVVELDRSAGRVHWQLAAGDRLDLERLAHPVLGAVGLIAANWRGEVALHGGVVGAAGGSRAWVVLAERGDGKSTTLAAAAQAGLPVFSDDLAVLDEARHVWSGPRCIDLRPQAAGLFPGAIELPPDGGRPRWRVGLDPVPARRVPVAGFVRLAWGEPGSEVVVRPAEPVHRLPLIAAASAVDRPLWSPRRLLDLAELPVFVIERPRELGALGAVVGALRSLPGG